MEERKSLLVAAAAAGVVTLGLVGLLYSQRSDLNKTRASIESTEREITTSRALISKTPDLERDVILQRETDEVVATILPVTEDMPDFTRTLRAFQEQAGVRISSLREKTTSTPARGRRPDFDKVAYTVQLEGDAFQILAFFNLIETYERFMSVPTFQLKAARRRNFSDRNDKPLHNLTLEVETYVYDKKGAPDRVRIDGYDRKRDLLLADINKRRSELLLQPYAYRGPRNRRDPWVDPRVPAQPGDGPMLSIEEQNQIVEDLVQRVTRAMAYEQDLLLADNLIAEMKARGELETHLAALEADVRRVESDGQLLFLPAERRFRLEVVDELSKLRVRIEAKDGASVPIAALREAVETMAMHIDLGEYRLAMDAYATVEPRLGLIHERDDLRAPLVARLKEFAHLARTVLEFNRVELKINGVAVTQQRPVALINGRAVAVGEMVGPDLLVLEIEREYITFLFKGVKVHQPIHSR